MKVSMLLLAAGRGTRLGGDVPKAFMPLGGVPLVLRAAERLCQVADPRRGEGELIVVVSKDDRKQHLPAVLPKLQALGARVVDGGSTRQESMANGLAASNAASPLVLVHDAARALFPVAAARDCLALAGEVGAALLAIPVPDTLKQVTALRVEHTVDRDGLWQAQTPQVMRRDLLQRALLQARSDGFTGTDEASLIEHAGGAVAIVVGSAANLKITRREDLALAEALLQCVP